MVSYVEFDKILTELQPKYERHFIFILQTLNLKYIKWKNLFQNIFKVQWWLINKTITNHARKEISLNQNWWSWKRPIVFIKEESSIRCLHPEVPRELQPWWLDCQSASYPLAIGANLTWSSSSHQIQPPWYQHSQLPSSISLEFKGMSKHSETSLKVDCFRAVRLPILVDLLWNSFGESMLQLKLSDDSANSPELIHSILP